MYLPAKTGEMHISVVVRQRPQRRLFPFVFAALFVIWVNGLLWWVITAAAIAGAVWWAHREYTQHQARCAAVIARADKQHQQVLSGDQRGVYGAGYPAWKKYQKVTR